MRQHTNLALKCSFFSNYLKLVIKTIHSEFAAFNCKNGCSYHETVFLPPHLTSAMKLYHLNYFLKCSEKTADPQVKCHADNLSFQKMFKPGGPGDEDNRLDKIKLKFGTRPRVSTAGRRCFSLDGSLIWLVLSSWG